MSTLQGNAAFHIGDRVQITFGRRKLTGVIVEDRGAIGVQGRHLYQVRVSMEPFEPMLVELPAGEMEAVAADTAAPPSIDKQQIMAYLASGGLIAMLRSNLTGGKHQPRAWLCLDNLGNVTHTFLPERGVLGGQVVPFWAVQDDKIFTPRRDAVVAFVEGFGLSPAEAERVVAEVGTMP